MMLVSLDFDGVLIKTENEAKKIFFKILKYIENNKNIEINNKSAIFNKLNGLPIPQISKRLSKQFKCREKKIESIIEKDWTNIYQNISFHKSSIQFLKFLKSFNVEILIISSSKKEVINRKLKQVKNLSSITIYRKKFNRDGSLNKDFLINIKKKYNNCQRFIHIDDNLKILNSFIKHNFYALHYSLNSKLNLKNIFCDFLVKNKINFFYKCNKINFIRKKLLISKKQEKLALAKFNKFKRKNLNLFNGNLAYTFKWRLINNKINLYGEQNKFSLRYSNSNIILSIAIQSIIVLRKKFLVGERNKSSNENNLYEFLPAGGLENFNKNSLKVQFINETFEEENIKLRNPSFSIVGVFFDFYNKVVDICLLYKIEPKIESNNNYFINRDKNLEHKTLKFLSKKKILEKSKKFTVTSKYLINYLLKKHNEY